MNKKLLLIILLSINLFGCQLAKENGADIKQKDQLMGVYITFEHLDLFDMDQYLNDNVDKLFNGTELSVTDEYRNRLYATYDESSVDKYDFGIEGVLFANLTYEGEYGEVYSVSGNGFVHDVHISFLDEKESIEGTLYLSNDKRSVCYINPVYKTEEGEVYLMAGTGISGDAGGTFSQWITETYTEKNGDKTSEKSFEAKVNFEYLSPSDYYELKQFDDANNLLATEIIYLDQIPDSIEKNNDTSYSILEGYVEEKVVERTLIEGEDSLVLKSFSGFNAANSYYVSLETKD